jgi:hypothetical protein
MEGMMHLCFVCHQPSRNFVLNLAFVFMCEVKFVGGMRMMPA